MKFSLLQKYTETPEICDITYDLSIDKSVRAFCKDTRRADYFLSILAKPLKNAQNIVYRQEILTDFINIPKLYDDMKLIFNRYDKAKNDWRELRTGVYPTGSSVNSRALLDYTFNSLKVTAIFPKTILSFFRSIFEILDKYPLTSHGLIDMKNYCNDMINNNSINEIARIAALFQYYTPEEFDFGVLCMLDNTLKLCGCDLCEISETIKHPNENALWKFFNPKKNKNSDNSLPVEADDSTVDDTIYIINEALHRIDVALSQVTNDVYETFFGISNELLFYDTAVLYRDFAIEKGISCIMPKILDCTADTFSAVGLCDLNLLGEGLTAKEIVLYTVDLDCSTSGVLIRGLNKTGKTGYLRAIGISQLFAQSGLPVCAKSAQISVRNAIFSHFSAAEEDFRAGDTSGRFEGEVQLIAKIMDGLKPYSMVLLNETFQTTSYSEGAEGICNILSVMPNIKVKFIFVTRLTKLFDIINDDKVIRLETGMENKPFEPCKLT